MRFESVLLSVLILLFMVMPAFAADPVLPDPKLTPGAVLTTNIYEICKPNHSKSVRHTTIDMKREVFAAYHLRYVPGKYEVDHLIPLGIGGADVKENLWPESHFTQPWNSDVKDRLEWKLYQMVCAREVDVKVAQQAFATNWIEAYQHYCPTDRSCPAFETKR